MNHYKTMTAEQLGNLYKKLKQIDENRKFRKTIDKRQITLEQAIATAERQTGINSGNISSCCLGQKKHSHAGGYKWKYKE